MCMHPTSAPCRVHPAEPDKPNYKQKRPPLPRAAKAKFRARRPAAEFDSGCLCLSSEGRQNPAEYRSHRRGCRPPNWGRPYYRAYHCRVVCPMARDRSVAYHRLMAGFCRHHLYSGHASSFLELIKSDNSYVAHIGMGQLIVHFDYLTRLNRLRTKLALSWAPRSCGSASSNCHSAGSSFGKSVSPSTSRSTSVK